MRTLTEIYDAIALEKANMDELKGYYMHKSNDRSILDDSQTLLDDLKTTSKVAIWRLLLWIVAVAIWIHEGLWDVFQKEVDDKITNQTAHTLRWYQEASQQFQYGDQMVWNDGYEYPQIDANKQIISRASAIDNNGIVKLKVATEVNSKMVALDATQLAAFTAFWALYKDAGVFLNIISISADMLHLAYVVDYDPTVLNADGSLISDNTSFPVIDAIDNYLANLDFNGKFSLEACDAAIRAASGVIDFARTTAQSKKYNDNYKDINIFVIALAGYFEIDPAYPLTTEITYNNV